MKKDEASIFHIDFTVHDILLNMSLPFQKFIWYSMSNAELKTSLDIKWKTVFLPLLVTIDLGKQLFKDEQGIKHVIPAGILVIGNSWTPMKSTFKNLMDVLLTHFTLVTMDKKNECMQALSFAYYTMCAGVVTCVIHFYGVNETVLISHAYRHLKHLNTLLPSCCPENIIELSVSFSMDLSTEIITALFRPYLGQNSQLSDKIVNEVLVIQTPFEPLFISKL